MLLKIACIFIFTGMAVARHVPDMRDLDEEDQLLFKAAYDTPYENYEYHEEPVGKLDLLKDGMWAIKTKIKEMKIINKALAANMLSTKLKLKELIASQLAAKKHRHIEIDKKPVYHYQSPSHQPSYQHYEPPQHSAPQYSAPQYTAPQHAAPQYTPEYPPQQYQPQQNPAPHYSAPEYPPSQYEHDPYYGH